MWESRQNKAFPETKRRTPDICLRKLCNTSLPSRLQGTGVVADWQISKRADERLCSKRSRAFPAGCLVIRGTRIVAQALLAIPDAPPAFIRHWRRQTSVPQGTASGKPSQVHYMYSAESPGRYIIYPIPKQNTHTFVWVFCFGIRQRPTLPGRLQPSTIGAERLNFCVRYGNRWDPFAIVTGISSGCAVRVSPGFGFVHS